VECFEDGGRPQDRAQSPSPQDQTPGHRSPSRKLTNHPRLSRESTSIMDRCKASGTPVLDCVSMPSQLAESESTVLLKIEKLVHGGMGIVRNDSLAVFVPGVLPGESVRALLDRPRKDYADGRLVEVVTPSADRIAPPCPVY